MQIIKHSKKYLIISGLLILLCVVGIFYRGLNIGIDFAGGSLLQITYTGERPVITTLQDTLSDIGIRASVQYFGEEDIIIRSEFLGEEKYQKLTTALLTKGEASIVKFESTGPLVSNELRKKAYIAITLVVLGIVLYIAFAFRHSSDVVSSWKYGLIAIIALVHDITIPLGVWAWLGLEINSFFVIAILSILGLSVNDTIVVFDRIRENILKNKIEKVYQSFPELTNASVLQTMTRSIFTSLTLILPLFVLYLIGPDATIEFALALLVGIIVGTYSSIFLAAPLLTLWQSKGKKVRL